LSVLIRPGLKIKSGVSPARTDNNVYRPYDSCKRMLQLKVHWETLAIICQWRSS